MASNGLFVDDASVNSLLDNLIVSAQQSVDATQANATTSQRDVTFTADTLCEGIEAVNILLSSSRLSLLPRLLEKDNNTDEPGRAQTVLAAALTTMVRIIRANMANIALRERAEEQARDAVAQLNSARAAAASANGRATTAADTAASARRRADAVVREQETAARRYTAEITELKTRLQVAIGREKTLIQEGQRREKEMALLKQRVHTIISTSRNKPVIQRVTFATSQRQSCQRPKTDSRRTVDQRARAAEETPFRVSEYENACFRNLLRAVQEELDELLFFCDNDGEIVPVSQEDGEQDSITKTGDHNEENQHQNYNSTTNLGNDSEKNEHHGYVYDECDGNDDNDQEKTEDYELQEGTPWAAVLSTHNVASAPTEDQMRLPFEMIQEEFEESLERKFQIVRSALTSTR